jgi:hypothetical protein
MGITQTAMKYKEINIVVTMFRKYANKLKKYNYFKNYYINSMNYNTHNNYKYIEKILITNNKSCLD